MNIKIPVFDVFDVKLAMNLFYFFKIAYAAFGTFGAYVHMSHIVD